MARVETSVSFPECAETRGFHLRYNKPLNNVKFSYSLSGWKEKTIYISTKTRFLFLMLGLSGMAAHAQTLARISILGRVADTLNAPLPGSTVLLMSVKDSSLVSFTRTGENGSFTLKTSNVGLIF